MSDDGIEARIKRIDGDLFLLARALVDEPSSLGRTLILRQRRELRAERTQLQQEAVFAARRRPLQETGEQQPADSIPASPTQEGH